MSWRSSQPQLSLPLPGHQRGARLAHCSMARGRLILGKGTSLSLGQPKVVLWAPGGSRQQARALQHRPAAAVWAHGVCRGFAKPVLDTDSQARPRENLLLQIPHKCQVCV